MLFIASLDKVIEASNTCAQKAGLVALIRALQLGKDKRLNIYLTLNMGF